MPGGNTTIRIMKKEARQEGREAFEKGLAREANPFKSKTFREAWDKGWNDGRFHLGKSKSSKGDRK